jgi:hypothetical protein
MQKLKLLHQHRGENVHNEENIRAQAKGDSSGGNAVVQTPDSPADSAAANGATATLQGSDFCLQLMASQ